MRLALFTRDRAGSKVAINPLYVTDIQYRQSNETTQITFPCLADGTPNYFIVRGSFAEVVDKLNRALAH